MIRVKLQPGVNIEPWAEVKFARAIEMSQEMFSRLQSWHATYPLTSSAVQVGPREAWVVLHVRSPPPVDVVASSFGDCVHNLRSALDAAVWSMATFSETTVDNPRPVQFPVAKTEKDFEKWLKSVPLPRPEFGERIRSLQPFTRTERLARDQQTDTLVALHTIDIVDKHRNPIRAASAVDQANLSSLGVRGDLSKLTFSVAEAAPLREGARLISVSSTEDFVLKDSTIGWLTAQFSVPYGGGFAPLADFITTAIGFTRNALDTLYGVGEPDDVDLREGATGETLVASFSAGAVTGQEHKKREGGEG